jgi:hypothetical protein
MISTRHDQNHDHDHDQDQNQDLVRRVVKSTTTEVGKIKSNLRRKLNACHLAHHLIHSRDDLVGTVNMTAGTSYKTKQGKTKQEAKDKDIRQRHQKTKNITIKSMTTTITQ